MSETNDQDLYLYKQFPRFIVSSVWKFMIVALSINLVLCFRGNLCIVAYIFLVVRIRTSQSDRSFITGDREDNFILQLYSSILSVAVLE